MRTWSGCRRTAWTLTFLVTAGCASTSADEGRIVTREGPTRMTGTYEEEMRLTTDLAALPQVVEASPVRVWNALPSVFEELGIPLTFHESEELRMGTEGLRTNRVGGERLSEFLDCGVTNMGRDRADRYAVTLRVTTRVVPLEEDLTRVVTVIDATARDRGAGVSSVTCVTRGTLERAIAERTASRVGAPLTKREPTPEPPRR